MKIADDTLNFNFVNFIGGPVPEGPNGDHTSQITYLDYSAATHSGIFLILNRATHVAH